MPPARKPSLKKNGNHVFVLRGPSLLHAATPRHARVLPATRELMFCLFLLFCNVLCAVVSRLSSFSVLFLLCSMLCGASRDLILACVLALVLYSLPRLFVQILPSYLLCVLCSVCVTLCVFSYRALNCAFEHGGELATE